MKRTTQYRWITFCVISIALCGPDALGAAKAATEPAAPKIPARTFSVLDYGARADGVALNTEAFRKTIAACVQAGGGVVRVPSGRYLTGPFDLASRICLNLEKGATVLFTDDREAYPLVEGRRRSLLVAQDCRDLMISGEGVLDGQGLSWWERFRKAKAAAPKGGPVEDDRPRLIYFQHCRRVRVEGVTLTNSPMFHLVPHHCQDVAVVGIQILAPADSPNTDGIDPAHCQTVHITRCRIDVGDDNIAVKAGADDPAHPTGPSRDLTIDHCTFLHGHGMSIGSETNGGLRGMTVRDCTFDGTDAGIRLKSMRGRGGLVENLTYSDLTMKNVKRAILITSYYPALPRPDEIEPPQQPGALTPIWRSIRIRNVTATGGKYAGIVIGLPETPISDLTLENVRIAAETGLRLRDIQGLRMVDTRITAEKGKPLLLEGHVEETKRAANRKEKMRKEGVAR